MYELLPKPEEEEFKNDIEPIFRKAAEQNKKLFNIYVGKTNRIVSDQSRIMSCAYVEHLDTIIIKNLVSEAKSRIKDELGAYFAFCSLLVDRFAVLVKERYMKSLIIHTNEDILLEVLVKKGFDISKTKNNFYKAFKNIK
jgi:hypothetical protein